MQFKPLAIPDIILIQSHVFADERGILLESYRKDQFATAGLSADFVQDNFSRSKRGSLRGLHYQIRQPQGKLIQVLAGEAFDVAVDLRRSSPTFGRWAGINLSAERGDLVWVPPGFAHGFYVLSDWADVLYRLTDYYAPQWERSLLWNDPALGIEWPIPPDVQPLVSEKDRAASPLAEADVYP